jgi:hypothetical protein
MRSLSLVTASLFALCFVAAASGCASEADESADELDLTVGTKPWDEVAEQEFSAFIQRIGSDREAGKCKSLSECLNRNKIRGTGPAGDVGGSADLNLFADCSKVGIGLRGYFAIKKGLAFKFVRTIKSVGGDPRYTNGNTPLTYGTASKAPNLQAFFSDFNNFYHSGYYRMAPEVENNDTYPIDVRAGTVKPGTVFYDPNGHVMIVYKVEANGTVRLMDGHPDNSFTVKVLTTTNGTVGNKASGGGFRNWRPMDGRMNYVQNARLSDYGTNQYGRGQDYVTWVRSQLSGGAVLSVEDEFGQLTAQLCNDIKGRVDAVKLGAPIAKKPLGDAPPNIYGAEGDWEAFSSPGRDQRLRASFRNLKQFVTQKATNPDIAKKLLSVWNEQQASCKVSYPNSIGIETELTLNDVQARIFDLSFDPYHCAEMRWGAYPTDAAEFATCNTQSDAHKKRFDDERTLRNIIERPAAGTPTPFGFGPVTPEDVDVVKALAKLAQPVTAPKLGSTCAPGCIYSNYCASRNATAPRFTGTEGEPLVCIASGSSCSQACTVAQ